MIPHWASQYVGIPFVDRGASAAGCNCWGLVHLIYRERAGIVLPTYAEVSARDLARADALFKSESACDPWSPAQGAPRLFDVLMARGRPLHVGVMMDEKIVLHVWQKTSAVLMPVSHRRLRELVIGHFRHRSLS